MEIARVYLDTHMGMGFDGLKSIMRKSKVDPDSLTAGKFTVFINRKQTKFKVLIGSSFLIYHNNGERKFPLEAISHFPTFFDGKKLDFSRAVEKVIMAKLSGKPQ